MGNGLCEQKGRVKMYLAKDDRYESMLYNRSGKSGLKLPAMSLGLWHNFGGESNYENMKDIFTLPFCSHNPLPI